MALQFVPHPGTVLICDYDLGRSASMPFEMTKRRPVVVISPHRRTHLRPYLVIPFSTQVPALPGPTHHRILAGSYDFLSSARDSWAKCELVSAVDTQRLDRLLYRGCYLAARLTAADLLGIRLGVIHALGVGGFLTAM